MNEYQNRPVSADTPGTLPKASSLDDINAILTSVGLEPMQSPHAAEQPQTEKTKHFTPVSTAAPSGEKTKHFSIGTPPPAAPAAAPRPSESSQMLLDGYADEEAPRRVSEADVEARLQLSRKNLVENFRVFSGEGEDNALLEKAATGDGAESVFDSLDVQKGEPLFDAVAKAQKGEKGRLSAMMKSVRFRRAQKEPQPTKRAAMLDAKATRETLGEEKKAAKRDAIVQLGLLAATLLLSLFASVYMSSGALAPLFDGGARLFTGLNLLLMAGSAVFARGTIKAGLDALQQRRMTGDVLALLLGVFAVLHGVVSLLIGMDVYAGIVSFSGCMVFVFFLRSADAFVQALAMRNDLSVMMRANQLQGLRPVEDAEGAETLGNGITEKPDPQILYAADTQLPPDYDAVDPNDDPHEKELFFGAVAACGVSLVFAVVSAILQKAAVLLLPTFVSCMFLLAPYLRSMISTLLKTRNDALLSVSGAVVSGVAAAQTVGTAAAIVLESADVFDVRVSRFRIVPGGRMATQDAALYAAATLHSSRSLLAGAFDKFLREAEETPPEAEDLQYEDRLGYACWIAGRRVLVGTREMLVQHSVPVPTAEEERSYAKDRCVLYVAVEGLVAATFLVKYRVRREAKKCVKLFNKAGTVLMLDSGDPSISEDYAAKQLSVHAAAIKILNTKEVGILAECKQTPPTAQSGLFCAKGQHTAPLLVYAAHNLFEADRLSGVVHFAGLAFCLLLLVLCVVLKFSNFFLPVTVIFLQLVWSLIAYFIGATKLKSSSNLK